MIGEILDHFVDRFLDPPLSQLVEHAAAEIHLRQQQSRERHLVVIIDERIGFQELFGLIDDFRGIPGEYALIEVFDRSKRRRVAEHDIEKSQPLHVAPEHHKRGARWGGQSPPQRSAIASSNSQLSCCQSSKASSRFGRAAAMAPRRSLDQRKSFWPSAANNSLGAWRRRLT
ncbi:MAG: hypothetical protein WA624_07925 [Methylocella sp.]